MSKSKSITDAKLDKLAKNLEKEPAERLETIFGKKGRINIRLSEAEKAEIEAVAKSLETTVSDYLLALHRIGSKILQDKNIIKKIR